VSSQPGWKGLVVTKLVAGQGTSGGGWQPFQRVELDLADGTLALSFAALSPDGGDLWLGAQVRTPAGQNIGYGAVEIELGTRRALHHRAPREGESPHPENLPLPHDVTGLVFDGSAAWFSSRSGARRWQESDLRSWTEDDGLESEVCHGVIKGPDGKIWLATSAGLARFDGKAWRMGGSNEAIPTRGLARDRSGRVWLATSRGLRMTAGAGAAPVVVVVDGDMRDVTVDALGRVWGLGATALAVIEAPAKNQGSPTADWGEPPRKFSVRVVQ
jgi:hypothetical protein